MQQHPADWEAWRASNSGLMYDPELLSHLSIILVMLCILPKIMGSHKCDGNLGKSQRTLMSLDCFLICLVLVFVVVVLPRN